MEENIQPRDTVLFVDDEENILRAIRRELMDEDYNCLYAESGGKALYLMERQPVSVVVSDMKMPGMDGLRLLREIKNRYPMTVRIVLSAYTQIGQVLVSINQAGIYKFITKPWDTDCELKTVVREGLEYYRLMAGVRDTEQMLQDQKAACRTLLKRMDNVVLSAKNNSLLSMSMGLEAIKLSIAALDNPADALATKKKLSVAESLFSSFQQAGFEEYEQIGAESLLSELASLIRTNDRIDAVHIDNAPCAGETMAMKPKLISLFLFSVINALTAFPQRFTVRLKPGMIDAGITRKFELSVAIGAEQPDIQNRYAQEQRMIIDVLNALAGPALSMLNGQYQAVMSGNTVTVKLVVADNRQAEANAESGAETPAS